MRRLTASEQVGSNWQTKSIKAGQAQHHVEQLRNNVNRKNIYTHFIIRMLTINYLTLMFGPKMYFALQRQRQLIIAFLFFAIPSCGNACFGRILEALKEKDIQYELIHQSKPDNIFFAL